MPNHVLEFPDPNVTVARHLKMLPIEIVVRDYLTGSTTTSIWPMYKNGKRQIYGYEFPDGMRKNEKLPNTIVTPTTKGEGGKHDLPITAGDIIGQKILPVVLWHEVEAKALALFARGREIAAQHGLILVDTKYEFGLDDNGMLTLADEIHTPDSSRYWKLNSYAERFAEDEEPESLDKEFLRLWIAARCDPYHEPIPAIPDDTLVDFSGRYIALYETITGQEFHFPAQGQPVRDRVQAALQKYVQPIKERA
jgi:phosphoribosylaminoimidazole-succinocarboxamide synthase